MQTKAEPLRANSTMYGNQRKLICNECLTVFEEKTKILNSMKRHGIDAKCRYCKGELILLNGVIEEE